MGWKAHATTEDGDRTHGLESPCHDGKSHGVAFFLHGIPRAGHFSAVEKLLLSHDVQIRQGANLPHWTLDGATYAVVFRLADSLPQAVVMAWREERAALVAEQSAKGTLTPAHEERLHALFAEKIECQLDAGHGACWLRRPEIASLVADALRYFDGERHLLAAWCVMPNHVHAVVRPLAPQTLPDVIQSWKGYSARAANRLLGRSGAFWQAEPYDHVIRDAADFAHAVRYVWENPTKAGLRDWPWVWASEEARLVADLEDGSGTGFPAREGFAGRRGRSKMIPEPWAGKPMPRRRMEVARAFQPVRVLPGGRDAENDPRAMGWKAHATTED